MFMNNGVHPTSLFTSTCVNSWWSSSKIAIVKWFKKNNITEHIKIASGIKLLFRKWWCISSIYIWSFHLSIFVCVVSVTLHTLHTQTSTIIVATLIAHPKGWFYQQIPHKCVPNSFCLFEKTSSMGALQWPEMCHQVYWYASFPFEWNEENLVGVLHMSIFIQLCKISLYSIISCSCSWRYSSFHSTSSVEGAFLRFSLLLISWMLSDEKQTAHTPRITHLQFTCCYFDCACRHHLLSSFCREYCSLYRYSQAPYTFIWVTVLRKQFLVWG